jgi:predicted enzyme involved in methoxymalonyl-ACP biosynthesis
LFATQAVDRAHVDRILRTAAAFSLTGEKRDLSDAEVDRILESGGCLLVAVSDRLSTYDPSGVILSRVDQDSLVIEELALSCPVLGKQVEYAVILGLAQIAGDRPCSRMVFEYKPSGRNQIMLKFLESITEPTPETRFSLPTAEANERIRKTAVAPGTWTLECGE